MPVTRDEIINEQNQPFITNDNIDKLIEHAITFINMWEQTGNHFTICDADSSRNIIITNEITFMYTINIFLNNYYVMIEIDHDQLIVFVEDDEERMIYSCDYDINENIDYAQILNALI